MDLPAYVTKEEVRRVCRELGLEDWTKLRALNTSEAEIVRNAIGGEALQISLEAFQKGLEVELEHGVAYKAMKPHGDRP